MEISAESFFFTRMPSNCTEEKDRKKHKNKTATIWLKKITYKIARFTNAAQNGVVK